MYLSLFQSTNMRSLTPEKAMSGECGFMAANLYAKSIFGEDALANVSLEKNMQKPESTVTGTLKFLLLQLADFKAELKLKNSLNYRYKSTYCLKLANFCMYQQVTSGFAPSPRAWRSASATRSTRARSPGARRPPRSPSTPTTARPRPPRTETTKPPPSVYFKFVTMEQSFPLNREFRVGQRRGKSVYNTIR